MAFTERHLLDALARMPFIESTELALILGEPHATVHRRLSGLLSDGITGSVNHGTAHLPSSGRYCLTAKGIREAARLLGFDTPSDFVEHELRARHPQGVIARLYPYRSYYWSNEPGDDQPPFPVTLFVVDTGEIEDTYVRTAARMSRMSLPILVSCIPVLSTAGILGKSWRPFWEPQSPRMALSGMGNYTYDSLYHRMRPRPVEGCLSCRRDDDT